MPFVRVTALFGSVGAAGGVYEEISTGNWSQVTPANGCTFANDGSNWALLQGASVLESGPTGGDSSSPATAAWTGYVVEDYAAPGEITDPAANPSAPGQLPTLGESSSVVTSPGSILPQAPGSPTAPGAVAPVAPGPVLNPDGYLWTTTQSLTAGQQNQVAANLGTDSRYLRTSADQTLTKAQQDQMGQNWPGALARYVEFEDDFERADTAAGTISDSPDGFVYEIRTNGDAYDTAKILNGEITTGEPGATLYFGGQPIIEKVYNIGADCIWRASSAGTGSNFTQGVFIIKNNDAWLSSLIHIRFSRYNVGVEVSEAGGTDGFVALADVVVPQDPIATFQDHWLPLDEKIRVEAIITGDRLQVFMGGWMAVDVTDSRIGSLNGNYVYWEHFGGGDLDDMFIDRVWVNDFRENGTSQARYQAASNTLSKLAAGILDLHSHATLRNGNLTLQKGDVRASKLRGRSISSGLAGAWAPALVHYGSFDDFLEPVANSTSASDENLWAENLSSNTLDEVGSMVEIHAIGKLANAESKDIAFRMAASVTATTSLSDGHFTIDAYIHRTTSNSHNVFVKITLSDGSVVMDSFDYNSGSATTFALAIRATAATAGSVTLQKVWGVMHHIT